MNIENVQTWLGHLEEGLVPESRHVFKQMVDTNDYGICFCSLGVALLSSGCSEMDALDHNWDYRLGPTRADRIKEFLGLSDPEEEYVIHLNDELRLRFVEIASVLRQEWNLPRLSEAK